MSYSSYLRGYTVTVPVPNGFSVLVDWDRNGNFTTSGDDVTDLVRGGFSVQYGRDQLTALAPIIGGQGGFALDNRDRRFSSRNTLSPLYGKIKPARPVSIARTVGGTSYSIFNGHSSDTPLNPDVDAKTVSMSLVDSLADFRGQQISTSLHAGVRTGEAIGFILDACGWPAALRDLDPGATVIPWWWESGTDALDALNKVVGAEGPPALLTVGDNGAIVFRDRHHRLVRAASTVSQGVWSGFPDLVPTMDKDFSYDEAWSNIVNTGTVSVDVRKPQALQQVWTSDATFTLAVGEQKLITASGSDPFYNAVAPVAGIDYQTTAGTVRTSLLGTSGSAATIVLTAVGGAAVVTGLQLRAQPLTVAYTVQVSANDSQSVTEHGARSFPGDLSWCGVEDAQAILSSTVAQRARPLTQVTAKFVCGDSVPTSQLVLVRDLSDRVTVLEQETVLSDDFYVESIQHDASGTSDHAVTFGLEQAYTPPTPLFRFDTTGSGFDQGKWGNGMDDPSTIFRFDTAGHGFDQGMWSS